MTRPAPLTAQRKMLEILTWARKNGKPINVKLLAEFECKILDQAEDRAKGGAA